MNPNLTEVIKPTQWKPGQSGNLNGRPVGTRQAFSAGFYRDLAEVFAKHGRAAMEKTAQDQPSVFFGICARLLPNDVRVTVEQSARQSIYRRLADDERGHRGCSPSHPGR